jgi:hypothetical protein
MADHWLLGCFGNMDLTVHQPTYLYHCERWQTDLKIIYAPRPASAAPNNKNMNCNPNGSGNLCGKWHKSKVVRSCTCHIHYSLCFSDEDSWVACCSPPFLLAIWLAVMPCLLSVPMPCVDLVFFIPFALLPGFHVQETTWSARLSTISA